MTILLPPSDILFGYVTAKIVRAIADSGDAGSDPDFIPAEGVVTFKPLKSVQMSLNYPAIVIKESITCTVSPETGELLDSQGNAGVWLVAGHYEVSFKLDAGTISPFTIVVSKEHTKDKPLDLANQAPLTADPSVKFVVTEQIYTETLEASLRAQQAAETAESEVLRQLNALKESGELKGDPGAGLFIKDELTSESQLPAVGQEGDAYLINGGLHLWSIDENKFSYAGNIQGPQGIPGPKGDRGPQGLKGDKGDQGLQGIQGLKGDTGARGLKGDPGDTGVQGEQGLPGERGPKGDKGDPGTPGAVGAQGPRGIQGPKGDPGEKGDKGDPGEKGETGTGIQIEGSRVSPDELPSTGVVGESYLVSGELYVWSPTENSYISAGVIKGEKGDPGQDGAQGPQGLRGLTGEKGPQGPAGPKGDTGDQGEPGPMSPDVFRVVNHGSNANTERPTGAMAVYWIGTAQPANAVKGDMWSAEDG